MCRAVPWQNCGCPVHTAQSSLCWSVKQACHRAGVCSQKKSRFPSSSWPFGDYCLLSSPTLSDKQLPVFVRKERLLFWYNATWLSVEVGLPLFLVRYLFCFYRSGITLQVVLVSHVQQCESALCTHASPPFWVSFPAHPASHASGSSQSPAPSCLCCIEASHQLSVLHMVSAAFVAHPTLSSPSVSTSPFFLSGIIMSILWYLFPGGGTWHSVGQTLVMKPYVTGSWLFKAICHLDHLVRFSFAVGNCSKEISYFSDLEGNNHLKTIYKRE